MTAIYYCKKSQDENLALKNMTSITSKQLGTPGTRNGNLAWNNVIVHVWVGKI